MLTLIHFDFCPFCQRVRLALGYKKLAFVETRARFYGPAHCHAISGLEKLPVLVFPDGSRQGESLEIIAALDRRFPATPPLCQGAIDPKAMETLLAWRARVSGDLFRLIAPVLPQYPELGDDARAMVYYRNRMENWLGATLEDLQAQWQTWYTAIEAELAPLIDPITRHGFYTRSFSLADTLITADLNGLRLIPGLTLPAELVDYFARVEQLTATPLLPATVGWPLGG
ncbi:MAG: glutathione S-transferase N-terminal domain-containing protein [Acidiferrobacter sp.]